MPHYDWRGGLAAKYAVLVPDIVGYLALVHRRGLGRGNRAPVGSHAVGVAIVRADVIRKNRIEQAFLACMRCGRFG
ncbi:hypothetical protein ACS49_02370 [Bacillus cereus]|nr:hypothetical protein ACS49_02370 [Bacillus cereus]